ncbi:MAG: thioredoxin family protein [Tenuifilaceae bacterium]|nr:thioredoxin family protein [Tenuifilaceae bacterium]
MDIKVLGPGCPNCLRLEAMCREIVNELGIDAEIEKITNVSTFPNYGVWLSPGLIINGQLKLQGKMPTQATLTGWIKNAM